MLTVKIVMNQGLACSARVTTASKSTFAMKGTTTANYLSIRYFQSVHLKEVNLNSGSYYTSSAAKMDDYDKIMGKVEYQGQLLGNVSLGRTLDRYLTFYDEDYDEDNLHVPPTKVAAQTCENFNKLEALTNTELDNDTPNDRTWFEAIDYTDKRITKLGDYAFLGEDMYADY